MRKPIYSNMYSEFNGFPLIDVYSAEKHSQYFKTLLENIIRSLCQMKNIILITQRGLHNFQDYREETKKSRPFFNQW